MQARHPAVMAFGKIVGHNTRNKETGYSPRWLCVGLAPVIVESQLEESQIDRNVTALHNWLFVLKPSVAPFTQAGWLNSTI